MKIGDYETHPAADLFPMMDGSEFDSFCESIRSGLRSAIIKHPDGSILDGRNRLRACLRVGTEPRFETWTDDGDPVAFVLDLNLERRHLSESQRSMIAGRIYEMERDSHGGNRRSSDSPTKSPIGDLKPKAVDVVAKRLNVGAMTVTRAVKVLREATPEVIAMVDDGSLAVSAAVEVARLPKDQQAEAARTRTRGKGTSSAKKGSSGRATGSITIPRRKYNELVALSKELRSMCSERVELQRTATIRDSSRKLHEELQSIDKKEK